MCATARPPPGTDSAHTNHLMQRCTADDDDAAAGGGGAVAAAAAVLTTASLQTRS